jgi:sigma-E factor negative regulatory protein RseC
MLDQGKIFKVEGKTAWIEFTPSSRCSKCGACFMSQDSGKMILEAENPVEAKVGDWVEVGISPASQTLFPLIIFGVPLLFLVVGIFLGILISENMAVILGIVFLTFGFLLLKLIDRYLGKAKKFKNSIIRKI